jgi:hypothetical protein
VSFVLLVVGIVPNRNAYRDEAANWCDMRVMTRRRATRRTATRTVLRLAGAAVLLLLVPCGAFAQQARPSIFAIDSSIAVDQSVDDAGEFSTGVIVDGVASAGLGRGFEAIVRPFAMRNTSGEWNRQIWVATLRYERTGPVGVRVDGGLIASPIGLANLTLRPHQNPTISQPASLFTGLPALERRPLRATLLGAVYPFGGQITVSGLKWDARAALIDTSPLRTRRVFAQANPPRFANVVVGGGVTPIVGLRFGASVTHGGWQRAGEAPSVTADLDATIVTVESEFSFRFTKLTGEWVRDALETTSGDRVASGWFVQGEQALTPRWFVSGRVERMSSPLVLATTIQQQRLYGFEETIGYRLTPELTLRGGHRARRGFGGTEYDHEAEASVVWWRRWM